MLCTVSDIIIRLVNFQRDKELGFFFSQKCRQQRAGTYHAVHQWFLNYVWLPDPCQTSHIPSARQNFLFSQLFLVSLFLSLPPNPSPCISPTALGAGIVPSILGTFVPPSPLLPRYLSNIPRGGDNTVRFWKRS